MKIAYIRSKKGVRSIGYSNSDDKVHIVFWKTESYIDVSHHIMKKGAFTFQGIKQNFKDCIDVENIDDLLRLLRIVSDKKDIAMDIINRIEKTFNISYSDKIICENQVKISILIDKWLFNHLDNLLNDIVSSIYKYHNIDLPKENSTNK